MLWELIQELIHTHTQTIHAYMHANGTHAVTRSGHRKQLAQQAARVMQNAKGGVQFAQGRPHSPHTGPQRLHMERKGPCLGLKAPSCLLGCICTISLKNQLSPLSVSPREGSGSPWMYCVQGLWNEKIPRKTVLAQASFLLTLGMHCWFESRKKEMPYCFLSTSLTLLGMPFASLDHLSCRLALEEKALWWQENPRIHEARMPSNGNAKDTSNSQNFFILPGSFF